MLIARRTEGALECLLPDVLQCIEKNSFNVRPAVYRLNNAALVLSSHPAEIHFGSRSFTMT